MTVNISLPDDIFKKAEELARRHHIPVEQVLTSAVVEHVGAWESLQERAARGSYDKFRDVMAKVPDVEPEERDRL